MSNPNAHTEFLLENIDSKASLNNTKLDTIATNTANIKASIEVGGDLYVSQDEVEAKLDTIITNTAASSSTGLATEAKQDTGNTSLASIDSKISDTHSKIDAMRGSNSITDLATKLNAGLPSALDSDRLKVRLDADLADTNSKIDAMRGSNSITDLATKLNAGLPSALNSDQLKVSDATTATKLDTIADRLIDDSNSVANSNNAINTNVITQNTNFHNKVAFIKANVDAESSPPGATTDILLTEDVPMLFKMTTLTNSTDAISTNLATTNSKLTTIDTDTGNIDTTLGNIHTTTSANNTLLSTITDRLIDDSNSVANSNNAINTNTIAGNAKLDTIISNTADVADVKTSIDTMRSDHTLTDLHTLLNGGLPSTLESDKLRCDDEDTHTKLDTIASRLIDDSNSVANSNNAINTNIISQNSKIDSTNTKLDSVIGTASAAYTGNGVILMGKVGDLSGDGVHSDSGIAQNDAQFVACDGEGNIGVTIRGGLMENSLTYNSGNATATSIRVAIATDDVPIALVNTKLDTLEASLTSMESKLDTMITHLATIAGDTTSLDGKLSASNTSGHYGNS